jgi:phosphoribosyl 1,2-cyclic phosphodiesterase
MILKTLGSSSHGNCSYLETDTSILMIDAGIKAQKIFNNINLDKLDGVLLSHAHGDHVSGVKDFSKYLNSKIKFYGNDECLEVVDIPHTKKVVLEELKPISIGEWQVIPFEVAHDKKCYNYIIKNLVSDSVILILTDVGYIDNIKLNVEIDYMITEFNHQEDVLEELIELNDENAFRYKRTLGLKGHLGERRLIRFLENNVGINTKKIILSHISRGFYEPNKFRDIIAAKFPSVEVFELDPTNVSSVQEVVLRKRKINFSEL